MKVLGIIPARYKATRFPGKLLAQLGDHPVIRHVWEQTKRAKRLTDVIIATDSKKIVSTAQAFKARTVFSDKAFPSGTARIINTIYKEKLDHDIIVNIQGDEPFINPQDIDRLVAVMVNGNDVMATLVTDITPQEIWDRNIVKAYVKNGYAQDFSRHNIFKDGEVYKHIGIYAYRREFLLKYYTMPKEVKEMVEKLEQLRAVENGYTIKILKTKNDTIGIDTKEDLIKARKRLKEGKC